ncbi:MAG: twin-arginine translocase subunit TatC [Chloroflexi bacterium]|nr:twin-arginine translocase subunit TatC [Chloroflexota bacterium]
MIEPYREPSEAEAEGGPELTIMEHLEELRSRIVKAGIALIVCTMLSLTFTRYLLELLIQPMGDRSPVALRPTETIIIYFKIALISGLVFAMPFILYQMARFVMPGLTGKERRYLFVLVPAGTLLFATGVAFAGLVTLPFAIKYLQGFLADLVAPTYSIDYYISFVTTILFWIGLVFEMPLIIAFLARLGIVSPKFLSKNRKFALLIIAVLAAMITPTPDPFNMTLVMLPLFGLYEVGVLLARLTYQPRTAPQPEPNAEVKKS